MDTAKMPVTMTYSEAERRLIRRWTGLSKEEKAKKKIHYPEGSSILGAAIQADAAARDEYEPPVRRILDRVANPYLWVPEGGYRTRLRKKFPNVSFAGILPTQSPVSSHVVCLCSSQHDRVILDLLASYPDSLVKQLLGVVVGPSQAAGLLNSKGALRANFFRWSPEIMSALGKDHSYLDELPKDASIIPSTTTGPITLDAALGAHIIAEDLDKLSETLKSAIEESSPEMPKNIHLHSPTLKDAALAGAKLGAVHASGEALIDLAKKLSPQIPMLKVMLETVEGREAVKVLLAVAIRYSAGAFPGQEALITTVTDLQITSSVAMLTGKYMGVIGETVANMTKNMAALAVPPVAGTFPAQVASVESVVNTHQAAKVAS